MLSVGRTPSAYRAAPGTARRTDAPRRILHVYSGNLYGGVETLLVTMARHAASVPGLEHVFALSFRGRLSRELEAAGARVFDLGPVRMRAPWTSLRARQRLRQLLRDERFDAVICHSAWPHVLAAPVVRAQALPLVFFLHDVATGTHPLERLAKRHAPDRVIANSEHTARSARLLFPHTPTEKLWLPVELPMPGARADVRARVRSMLGAGDGTFVVLMAARMQSWKGHALFIEALSKLDRKSDWEAWIAGGAQRPIEEEYARSLEDRVRDLGLSERVRFLGQRSDVGELMQAADVLCQPNTSPEPFGIVFVEALARGLPVVATKMGGALEIVDESSGVLAEPTAGSVARAIERLMHDPELLGSLSKSAPGRARFVSDPKARLNDLAELVSRASSPGPENGAGAQGSSPEDRATLSHGGSDDAVKDLVLRLARADGRCFSRACDVGCGTGTLFDRIVQVADSYVGLDIVRYPGFVRDARAQFERANLDEPPFPVSAGTFDLTIACEVIEHLENPRAFMRELARITQPGGRIIVTTPNQLSFANKLSFAVRNQHIAFQAAPGLYPSHITALLAEDLERIAREMGLEDIRIAYTNRGRMPLSSRHWPAALGGRAFSDNVAVTARVPLAAANAGVA